MCRPLDSYSGDINVHQWDPIKGKVMNTHSSLYIVSNILFSQREDAFCSVEKLLMWFT